LFGEYSEALKLNGPATDEPLTGEILAKVGRPADAEAGRIKASPTTNRTANDARSPDHLDPGQASRTSLPPKKPCECIFYLGKGIIFQGAPAERTAEASLGGWKPVVDF
jgi:hypothetical protein